MLVVAGVIGIDPANRDAAVAAALRMMEETQREPGCISYTFSADLADPGCTDADDDSEKSPGLICDDGLDNDGDLATDFPSDAGCASAESQPSAGRSASARRIVSLPDFSLRTA